MKGKRQEGMRQLRKGAEKGGKGREVRRYGRERRKGKGNGRNRAPHGHFKKSTPT